MVVRMVCADEGKTVAVSKGGTARVWLSGSKASIMREIFTAKDGRCFIKYYGNIVEVKRITMGYATVEKY